MDPKTAVSVCEQCTKKFKYDIIEVLGVRFSAPRFCRACNIVNDQKQRDSEEQAHIKALTTSWHEMCPPIYQDTDWELVKKKSPGFAAAVDAWMIGKLPPYFVGDAGACKTRCGFELIKRHHFVGTKVFAISSRKLAWAASRQFDSSSEDRTESRDTIVLSRKAKILLLDDVLKEKLTDTVEGELYELLEFRTSNKLPTIWTANSGGDAFAARISADRRDAILRRLTEFGEKAMP